VNFGWLALILPGVSSSLRLISVLDVGSFAEALHVSTVPAACLLLAQQLQLQQTTMEDSPKQQFRHQVFAQSSLYEASPTPSDEGGGVSPVKTRMATRFFSPATQPPPAAMEAVVAALASTSGNNGSSNSISIPGRSSASMPARCSAPGHLADSIYGRQLQDSIQQQLGSSSSPAYRMVSATQSGKHKLLHSQDVAGSHTSLLLVEHLEGTEVRFGMRLCISRERMPSTSDMLKQLVASHGLKLMPLTC
jgi:hypothetical protein